MDDFHRLWGALVALASGMFGMAGASVAATPGAIPTFYLSKLPLDQPLTTATTPTDEFQFYCQSDLKPVGDGAFTADKSLLVACGNDRLLSTRNDPVEVDLVQLGACPAGVPPDAKLKIEEKARKTVFATEVSSLITALASRQISGAGVEGLVPGAPALPIACVTPLRYVLQDTRANATLSVTFASSKDNPTYQVVTGPPEHWFVTGDAIVRGVKELKYDPTAKTVVERDKPQQFYVGFNYMFGDVLTKYHQLAWQRGVVKVMLSPTKKPFDSVGVGLGYRLIDGAFHRLDDTTDAGAKGDISGGLVLFVGRFWSKNDKVDATTGAVTQGGRSQSWRVGLSYDVSSLMGWLK
jgi:hypothetical protein